MYIHITIFTDTNIFNELIGESVYVQVVQVVKYISALLLTITVPRGLVVLLYLLFRLSEGSES